MEYTDNEVFDATKGDIKRQQKNIELAPSESFVRKALMDAAGSVLTNIYAEGYLSKQNYGGSEHVDVIENIARDRARELFGAEHANVQPHSGSQANATVYFAMLNDGDTVLGMDLSHGGHLTHGSPVNISGKPYNFVNYGVDKEIEVIDYDEVREIALRTQPKMIVAGASVYPRLIDFSKFREIANEVGAYLMVDMSHIAGLVAAGFHPSPVPYADFVTSTTQNSLRGPRGGLILCKREYAQKIDKSIFPGLQDRQLMHAITGKAVAFDEALKPEFKKYSLQTLRNTQVLVEVFGKKGIRLVSNGSDNHLMLLDVSWLGLTGKKAEQLLESVGITTNKNAVPYEMLSPFVTSGIRIDTAAVTARGFVEEDMELLGRIISNVLKKPSNATVLKKATHAVVMLTNKYPL